MDPLCLNIWGQHTGNCGTPPPVEPEPFLMLREHFRGHSCWLLLLTALGSLELGPQVQHRFLLLDLMLV